MEGLTAFLLGFALGLVFMSVAGIRLFERIGWL